jgi:uncharacterized membrane protein YphA (DoxX/SURF4 family)
LVLALLRVGVGWHFAYEGLTKLLDPSWTSAGYLRTTQWVGADLFQWLANNPTALQVVDFLNIWGLLLIGGALMLGCLTRWVAVSGIVMLALYYIAHPPLFANQMGVAEGSYLIVNKNLVELLALCVVAVFPAGRFGLDGLLFHLRRRTPPAPTGDASPTDLPAPAPKSVLARRQVLACFAGLPFVGAFVMAVLKKQNYRSQEESQLKAHVDGTSGATMKSFDVATLDDLKGQVPTAKIGDVEFSRLILGGNLMNGFAHARDLIYVSKLIRAYHRPERIFETFRLAEACGVNTILTNPMLAPVVNEYWERGLGNIRFIAQCKGKTEKELMENIQYSIDHGACAAYVQGAASDTYVQQGNFDWIARSLDLMRSNGIPAGIGGHYIRTIMACVEEGFEPDYWMKTLHHHNYWSAKPEQQHDNIWCEDPQQTISFMEQLPQPWIAFKVLAAGSITPKTGFKYAFENGADFICAGMYDFQVVEDANIALDVLGGKLARRRAWYA